MRRVLCSAQRLALNTAGGRAGVCKSFSERTQCPLLPSPVLGVPSSASRFSAGPRGVGEGPPSAPPVPPTPWLQSSPSFRLFSGQKGPFASPSLELAIQSILITFETRLSPSSATQPNPVPESPSALFLSGGAEKPQDCWWVQGPASPDWLHPPGKNEDS